uniref:Tetraspanin n=1 Tax=Sander lucioperca TaxID=283035 RepID=A0A8D0D722_SANLU
MTQVNCCLKWLLTIFNIIFAIVGIIIIVVTLNSQFTYANGALALDVHTFRKPELYIVGSIIMVIAILGAVGAYRESKACMILFLVCMILGSIVMLLPGTVLAVIRPQVASMQEETYRGYLPLDKAPIDKRHKVDSMQREMQCCGLFSYKDWEGNIPDSCLCNKLEEMEGKCQTVDYRGLLQGVVQQKKSVYIQACFPIVSFSTLLLFDVVMGTFFTLAVLGLLGMVLSSIMIHQLRNPNRPVGVLMSVPAYFNQPPPKYEELQNIVPSTN